MKEGHTKWSMRVDHHFFHSCFTKPALLLASPSQEATPLWWWRWKRQTCRHLIFRRKEILLWTEQLGRGLLYFERVIFFSFLTLISPKQIQSWKVYDDAGRLKHSIQTRKLRKGASEVLKVWGKSGIEGSEERYSLSLCVNSQASPQAMHMQN